MPAWFIVLIILEFACLGYFTKFMTVRLYRGNGQVKTQYASYRVCTSLRKRKAYWQCPEIHAGDNFPTNFRRNGEPCYDVVLTPGVTNILCGWEWLDKHCADMVDYKPEVFMAIANIRYTMTIKQPSIIKNIIKANHLTRREKKELLC
jgi:hypothetical protein